MRKMVLLLILATASCIAGRGQVVRLGVLGGLHSSNVLETNHLPGWDTAVKPYLGSRSGFQLGLILEVPIGHKGFFLQPALTYITKGRSYDRNNDSVASLLTDTIYNKTSLNVDYIEIPVNLTYKIPLTRNGKNHFFLSAGPYFSFFYGGNVTTSSLTQAPEQYASQSNPISVGKGPDTYRTLDIGINGRVGFELGNLMVSTYFSRGLTSFYNATYPGTFYHELFGGSVAIWLTSSGAPQPERRKEKPAKKVMKDTDKDGIPDDEDRCPAVPGVARYQGCPIPDSDQDGIDDEHDSCKTTPGVVRYHGCPIPDRDGDGVNDEDDLCPDSAGPAENRGCPLPMPRVVIRKIDTAALHYIDYIAHNILFAPNSDRFAASTSISLDSLAARLKVHPEWMLAIEGHTDNSGTAAGNRILSQKRADAVRRYLVKKGIPAGRLSATGFGQDRPVADNATPEGRAANRRVELKLSLAHP